ncbi:MAG: hypothetical protein M0R50_09155 [Candidatus Cloacimonetes bacterium]|jgi:hypothetical protein|nr:hypothetical protein [Candidatus Cloacimonadota bacterium]
MGIDISSDIDDDIDDIDSDDESKDIDIDEDDEQIKIAKPRTILLNAHIHTTRKNIAYITLLNDAKIESFAECKSSILKTYGVVNEFDVIISNSANEDGRYGFDTISVTIKTPKKEQQLSRDEWEFMSETIIQTLSDNKMIHDNRFKKYKID